MPDSVYQQTLNEVLADVTTLDASALEPTGAPLIRRLNWEAIRQEMGLFVCWGDDVPEVDDQGNNNRDMRGYPVHIVYVRKAANKFDDRHETIMAFYEDVRQHFNRKRRMSAVSATGVTELGCRVVEQGPRPPRNQDWADYEVYSLTVIVYYLEPRLA